MTLRASTHTNRCSHTIMRYKATADKKKKKESKQQNGRAKFKHMTKCIKCKCSTNTKTKPEQGHTPIIAVTCEAGTREFQVQGQYFVRPCPKIKNIKGWGHSTVVKRLPSMPKAWGSIPKTTHKIKQYIKDQFFSKKDDPILCYLQETHFKYDEIGRLEMKGWKKHCIEI